MTRPTVVCAWCSGTGKLIKAHPGELVTSWDVAQLFREVEREYAVPIAEMIGEGRVQRVAEARHEVWLRLAEQLGMGPTQISAYAHRDHSTVIAGIRRARDRRAELNGLAAVKTA